jgi:protein-disulfide reductase (glutathione)
MNSLDEAKAAAEENGRPILLLIHKSWCGACKALRTVFADSDAIEHQAAHFNMVNLEDDEEPKDKAFQPDGGYIPRIMFLTSKGLVKRACSPGCMTSFSKVNCNRT